MRIGLAIAAVAAACGLVIGSGSYPDGRARAEEAASYPSFPIKIVVPYPAGSIPDTLGRMIGDQLQTQLGKPVVIENRAGASTLIGAKVVANAEPDGYTLLIPTVTTLSIAPQINPKTGVDPVRDFTPLARLGGTNFFLVVRSSFPAKTMREWIDEVKRNPGKYRYASAGMGTPHHIFMELLKKQFGLDITHVPYKGSIEALPDLLAERVDMAFLDGSQAAPSVTGGKLRALGTSMAKQTDLIAGVPPIAATVPGFDWSGWIAVAGPRGMPKPVVARIAEQIAQLQTTPRFADALRNSLMEAMPALSPDESAAFVRDEYVRWKPIIELSGATE
jgi:tripartite-type tricarboxylate transporter receptor subunit TctC